MTLEIPQETGFAKSLQPIVDELLRCAQQVRRSPKCNVELEESMTDDDKFIHLTIETIHFEQPEDFFSKCEINAFDKMLREQGNTPVNYAFNGDKDNSKIKFTFKVNG